MSWYCLCGNRPLVNVLNHPDNPLSPGVVWVDPPHEGTLTRDLASCLADVLAMHCFSDSCWFGIWEGFGYTDSLPETASFNALDQRYSLYRAPLGALQSSFYPDSYGFQTANMVWPDNEAWYLASPFNCDSTYIGGSEELVSAVLADRTLEAYRIEPHKSIWEDTINPPKEAYPVYRTARTKATPSRTFTKESKNAGYGRLEKVKNVALARQKTLVISGSRQDDRERLTR